MSEVKVICAPEYCEPTAPFILVAVKALLKSEAPHAAILAMIADLEVIGERERQEAHRRKSDIDLLTKDFGVLKAMP